MNVNQAIIYFKLVGSPYKSTEHYQKVRYLGLICGVWSIAFAIKFIAFALGGNLFTAEKGATTNRSYSTALLLAIEDFLTLVIPIFLVVEKDFVSIMAAEFLDQTQQLSLSTQLNSTDGL